LKPSSCDVRTSVVVAVLGELRWQVNAVEPAAVGALLGDMPEVRGTHTPKASHASGERRMTLVAEIARRRGGLQ